MLGRRRPPVHTRSPYLGGWSLPGVVQRIGCCRSLLRPAPATRWHVETIRRSVIHFPRRVISHRLSRRRVRNARTLRERRVGRRVGRMSSCHREVSLDNLMAGWHNFARDRMFTLTRFLRCTCYKGGSTRLSTFVPYEIISNWTRRVFRCSSLLTSVAGQVDLKSPNAGRHTLIWIGNFERRP